MSLAVDEARLIDLRAWRAALLAGADVGALLRARHARLAADRAPAAWIHLADLPALAERIDALNALSRQFADRAALIAAYPLFGTPFAVKDNIDAAGMPTTAACPAFAKTPEQSATVVQKLLDAGAVLFGKTNLDQFATGLVGARSPFGAPSSVCSPPHVSGGSSSGSAVAVARGEVLFALGTDTAGSGRIPAGFNGLVGLKPTPGRVSTAGVLPACRTLDCVSIFAHTVDDAAAVLAVIEGADTADEYSAFLPGRARFEGVRPRVLVPEGLALAHDGYGAGWTRALDTIAPLADSVTPIDLEPLYQVARLLYEGPWVAERYSVVRTLIESQPEAMDPTVAAVIGRARQFDAVATFQAQYQLQRARQALNALWADADILMVPTAPRHPSHAALAADPIGVNAELGQFTNFVNLLGWCALAVPAGLSATGLPFGVTFIARANDDAALAHWARTWEAAFTQRAPDESPPHPAPAVEATMPIAAVGAHMSGLPLNRQLTERRAVLRERTQTAPRYRLYALAGAAPARPGMVRVDEHGVALDVEVWNVPVTEVGSFLALIPSPLGLGTVELANGERVHGFLCEAAGLHGATDISAFGGWRGYLASRSAAPTVPNPSPGLAQTARVS
ncbi:MAG: allophanate hydrolase [Burkholderiaceae bacterium]